MMLMMMKLEQVPTFFCSDTAMLTSSVNYHAHINCELPWRCGFCFAGVAIFKPNADPGLLT